MVLKSKVRIRFCLIQSLILAFLFSACTRDSRDHSGITVHWENSVAMGLIIPRELLSPFSEDSLHEYFQVHLLNDSLDLPVFGEYRVSPDAIIFQPLIPLTAHLSYDVLFKGKSLGVVKIPPATGASLPAVITVYPSEDTLPENLLKMYILFSSPMREADPLSYLYLVKNGKDTLRDVFLDLHPALWDKEGTTLTLWLDPGRIKRDLQPNKNLGTPLRDGESYSLVVDERWPSKAGSPLVQSFYKFFTVTSRDTFSPALSSWRIQPPKRQTSEPLIVQFPEPLDYILLEEAIMITGSDGKHVEGRISTSRHETVLGFTPLDKWNSGVYKITAESRLEDLAGNNLNRLFDQDVSSKKTGTQQDVYVLEFRVE